MPVIRADVELPATAGAPSEIGLSITWAAGMCACHQVTGTGTSRSFRIIRQTGMSS
jgi:hypothetical protein